MSAARRVACQLPLGFAAGIPLYLSGATLSKWLADSGVSIESVGLFGLVALPYNLKFLWAPLLDRYVPPFLGRRRGWLAVLTLATAVAIAVMSRFEPSASVRAIALAALAVATLSASLDIVVDAYRTDTLAETERGRGTAMYLFGYRGALLVSGSLALFAADRIGWQATYLGLSAVMAIGSFGVLFAPRSEVEPEVASLGIALVAPLRELLGRGRLVFLLVAFIALFRFGDGFVEQLLLPFLGERGFSNSEIAGVQKGIGLFATIVGVGIGGVLTDRIGVFKALLIFGSMQALANAGYLFLATSEPSLTGLIIAVVVDNLCNGFGFAALVAFLMTACNRKFSATQYAIFTSLSTLLGRLIGASAGFIQASTGWPTLFAISIVSAAPALLILSMFRPALKNLMPLQSESTTSPAMPSARLSRP